MCVSQSSKCGLRGVRAGPQSPRRRSPSQDDGEPDSLSMDPHLPSEEQLDALQQNLSDTTDGREGELRQVIMMRQSHKEGQVLCLEGWCWSQASGDTVGSVQGRRFERGENADRLETPSENAENEESRTPLTGPVSFVVEHAVNEAIMDTPIGACFPRRYTTSTGGRDLLWPLPLGPVPLRPVPLRPSPT